MEDHELIASLRQRLSVAEKILQEIADSDVGSDVVGTKDASDDGWCYMPWWLSDQVRGFVSGKAGRCSCGEVPARIEVG